MIKARASGSKVYLYFMKKGRQARHRIPRNSCLDLSEGRENCKMSGKSRGISRWMISSNPEHITHQGPVVL